MAKISTVRQRGVQFLHDYGLGILLAANVFGAGSVYILSNTGANHGFSLLWVFPLMLAVDIVMHDMSARLATIDKPLMEYIKEEHLGWISPYFAIGIALIMQLWAVANYAISGFALAWFLPIDPYIGIIIMAGLGVLLVEQKLYQRIEGTITGCIGAVFVSYLFLLSGLDISLANVATGFVPSIKTDIGYMTMIIALLGTTVYYPNFFIQSSIYPTKQWDSIWQYRKDNIVGIFSTIVLSASVVVVSAIALQPGEMALTTPGKPLTALLGAWALPVFVAAVWLASFTSATGTLFGAGFMVPQSFGVKTKFGDWGFRMAVGSLIWLSAGLAVLTLSYTDMTPVRLAITMPALNGVIGLPITVLALWGAVNEYFDITRRENVIFGIVAVILLAGSLLTASSLYETISSFL